MLRRAWKPIAATTLLIGTPSYWYYSSKYKQQTFDLAVRTKRPDGSFVMAPRTFTMLSKDTVDVRLRENAMHESKARPGGIVWNHSTASYAANDPIEDAHSNQIIERDSTDKAAPGDLLFFAVMDGHGGFHTSRLLSKVLINAVALELSSPVTDPSKATNKPGILKTLNTLLWSPPTSQIACGADPRNVSLAIQNAFTKLDSELINTPLRIIAANLDEVAVKNKIVPDLSKHPMALQSMLPAVSGACALMAVLDTAHRDLYIACTGDSRAVAGIWEESADGSGSWRVEVLSEDQTGRNPDELERMQSEHPVDEKPNVIRNGRVLGGLEPTRAFGDARYKWPREVQEILNQAFLVGNDQPLRPPPTSFKTPPYVTAKPVVTHRKLSFLPLPDGSYPKPSSTLRFLVLATDGLWDQLTSEEVVSLVGGHLSGLKGIVTKSSLPILVPTTSGSPTVEGKSKQRSADGGRKWAFVDDNPSVHLIRNAFGGGDEKALRRLLSIPAPYARRHRDDVTVTVVWWQDGREGGAQVTKFTVDEKVNAKL